VYGISGNKRAWYDNSNAYRLGYRPQDDSEVHAQEVLAREKPGGDPVAEKFQGGVFCVAEEVPNPAPLPRARKKPVSRRKAARRK
jgi:uronate dehydrogenase